MGYFDGFVGTERFHKGGFSFDGWAKWLFLHSKRHQLYCTNYDPKLNNTVLISLVFVPFKCSTQPTPKLLGE